ncbi:MAG: acyloxyacyl hydrolase [Ignavibacteriaceae bacterium]|jgi:hypothetical protein|nr:acyloxyacyl hydrolase [Ignavibacteriaceae bacterium]
MNIKIKNTITVLILFAVFNIAQLYPQSKDLQYISEDGTEQTVRTSNRVIGAGFLTGYMISHAKEVINLRGLHPQVYEIVFGWHLNNDEVWNDCHCYPRAGVFLAYHNLINKEVLGEGYSGGLSFTYFFGIPGFFNPHIKGKAGLSYLTKPFDKETHPDNMAYATHLNFLISVGTGISLRPTDNLELQIDGSMNHQSNAAILEPNGGINYWAISLSTNYFLDKPDFYERNIPDPYLTSEKKTRWDLSFSWGISSMPYPMPGQVPMYGITILRSWQLGRVTAFTLAGELERNGRAVEITRRQNPEADVDPLRASVLTGIEFLMGRTIFSIQIGGYVHRPFKEKDDFYQRWGLVYNIWDNFYAGINFKSYRNSADHVSIRGTYSF